MSVEDLSLAIAALSDDDLHDVIVHQTESRLHTLASYSTAEIQERVYWRTQDGRILSLLGVA